MTSQSYRHSRFNTYLECSAVDWRMKKKVRNSNEKILDENILLGEKCTLLYQDFPRMLRSNCPENISHRAVLWVNHSQNQQSTFSFHRLLEVSVLSNTYTERVVVILNVECLLEWHLGHWSYVMQPLKRWEMRVLYGRGWVRAVGYRPKNRMNQNGSRVDGRERSRRIAVATREKEKETKMFLSEQREEENTCR